MGFYDGIRVGANANAQSNVLVNIVGDTQAPGPGQNPPINVVHITNLGHTVSDISIMGAYNVLAGGDYSTYTIQDDLTGTQLSDKSVSIYALGQFKNNGYSRYTTSPKTATWVFGSNAPAGNCATGSLYSCLGSSSNCQTFALWACGIQWTGIK